MAGRRSISNMMDANLDISNGALELINNSAVTGWTTQIVLHYTVLGGGPIQAFQEYLNVKDANGEYPENTGVIVDTPNQTATVPSFPVNVGLRHYHQQCQAMKGTNNNFTLSSNTSMGGDNPLLTNPPSSNHITQVSDGSGFYKKILISMRGFRGFQYHQNFNSIWNASTGQGATREEMIPHGKIQIGNQQ